MTALVVALAAAVLLLAVLVAGLLRSHAEILKALHELGAGLELDRAEGPVDLTIDGVRTPRHATGARTAEAVTGETLEGEAVALSLTSGVDTLLAFLSSGCSTCGAFWDAFSEGTAESELDVPGNARLVVVTKGLDEESASALAQRAPRQVQLVASSSAWEGFAVPGSPYFVYVDGTGRVIGEGSAATWSAVRSLMGQAHADDAHRHPDKKRRLSRQGRDDAALAAAGISPGDASLS